MIGHFWFRDAAAEADIIVELIATGTSCSGRVRAPASVVAELVRQNLPVRAHDEVMDLPFALSYGVLLASMSKTNLTISGDRSAWPEDWGALLEGTLRFTMPPRVISH